MATLNTTPRPIDFPCAGTLTDAWRLVERGDCSDAELADAILRIERRPATNLSDAHIKACLLRSRLEAIASGDMPSGDAWTCLQALADDITRTLNQFSPSTGH